VDLARELALPIILHTRESDAETLALLEQWRDGDYRGILHCFGNDTAFGRQGPKPRIRSRSIIRVMADAPVTATVPSGLTIALYSLEENALARATKILKQRHPGLAFLTASDHVASDNLKLAAQTADLFVIVDRAAKHAATDAIKAERRDGATRYATGKGSTSLIETVEAWLREQQSVTD
jgi:hypothetical protein